MIYLSPDSQLKYLKRRFDENLIDLADHYITPTDVVWDIGANCGVFAFSADKAKYVVLVEADPFLANMLLDSARINNAPFTLVCAAASSAHGLASFSIAERGRASNHLTMVAGRGQQGGERSRILVPTITLDALLAQTPAPTFVKIDVEGAELSVLQGAARLLAEVRPTIYIETGTDTHEGCTALLKAARYDVQHADGDNWLCTPEPRTGAGSQR